MGDYRGGGNRGMEERREKGDYLSYALCGLVRFLGFGILGVGLSLRNGKL